MFNSIVESVFSHAQTTPDKLALADDSKEVSYLEYSELVKRYAEVLKSYGVKKNEKVVLEACQTVDYLALELAVQLLGGVFVPLEHNCSVSKIQSIVSNVSAVLAVTDQEVDTTCTVVKYNQLLTAQENNSAITDFVLPCKDEVSEILFSTGTTGKEKGIVLTHGNSIALAHNVIHGVEMEVDNVELIPSPMNHSHGLRRYYANMFTGSTVIILGSAMNVRRLFFCLDNYGVNSMDLVPAALAVIMKLSRGKLADYKDKLRYIQFGAAPMSEDDKDSICNLLPHTRMYNFYGSTESGCTFIYNFNVPERKKNCIGKATYSTKAILTDDDRNEISTDEGANGLLATVGGMNMLGYWLDEEETAKALRDGVVYSNDIAYFDEDGDVILMGRKGDVINVGGNKVSPDEIEEVAKRMDIIADCGCVPAPDKSKGQVPKLFVQLKPGAEFDMIAIRTFLSANLEPFKVPTIIVQIEKIPRSFNGKLLRKELV